MQVQTDFTHPLKFNCSSIASSTPGNNISFPEGQFIKFQEFDNESEQKHERAIIAHKRKLTIEINDSYDFNQSSVDQSQSVFTPEVQSATNERDCINGNFFKKHEKSHEGLSYCIGDSQSPSFANSNSNSDIDLHKLLSFNSFLQEKIKDLQHQNNELKMNLNSEKAEIKSQKTENQALKIALRKKQQAIFVQKERNNKLTEKIAQMQQQKTEHMFYDEKIRQKQGKIQQLQRKLEKITTMNKTFQKQLKQSDKKIMQLEKDLQKTFCQNQQETISRIKQSSVKVKQMSLKSKQLHCNKENQSNNVLAANMGNTLAGTIQLRKSIDKKKVSQSQGKKKQPLKTSQSGLRVQRPSTSNIMSKKLLVLKKQ